MLELAPPTLAPALPGEEPVPCLRGLRRHDLAAAEALPLLQRYDSKFLLPALWLEPLLALLKDDYSVLALGKTLVMDYDNRYLDSPDFRFYAQQHNQKLRRLKLRFRTYKQSGARFFELKVKNDGRRTAKSRVRLRGGGETLEELLGVLDAGFPREMFADLHEVLSIGYRRISLLNLERRERISIDFDVAATRAGSRDGWRLRGLAVVEVKQERMDRSSPAFAALRALGLHPGIFSKYCVSCNLLYPGQVKTNRFKKLLGDLSPFIEIHKGEVPDGPASA